MKKQAKIGYVVVKKDDRASSIYDTCKSFTVLEGLTSSRCESCS